MEAEQALRTVERLYARLNGRRGDIRKAEDYYNGKQPLSFATKEWMEANAARYAGFADNWCRPVVDAEGERLRHTGVRHSDAKSAGKLWDWWQRNDGDAQSSQGFVSTLATSRSFVHVWTGSDGEPVMTWQHPEMVEIEYDPEDWRTARAGLKTWVDDDHEYATLYTIDEVFKYERSRTRLALSSETQAQLLRSAGTGSSWTPREVAGETWPFKNHLGAVPLVEIPNRPLLGGDPVSEIKAVMPMQDAANLLWAYLFLSADYASMPARVVLGQAPPKVPILDAEGNKIGEKSIDIKDLQEKRLLYLTSQTARIDSWEAAKLDVFTEVIEYIVGHIAAQTRTPPTYLVTKTGMSNVNGEGLKASEIGLVKKTIEFQTFATPKIREVYRLMALASGDPDLAEASRTAKIAWANPEIRSESQLADALSKKKSIGYPLEYLLELDGLDPTEVTRVLDMVEQEQHDAQLDSVLRGFQDANPGRDGAALSGPADGSGPDAVGAASLVGPGNA